MTRDELKVWLDRKPERSKFKLWRRWYDFDEARHDADARYLGTSSARTGPDPVATKQPCQCRQCRPEVNDV